MHQENGTEKAISYTMHLVVTNCLFPFEIALQRKRIKTTEPEKTTETGILQSSAQLSQLQTLRWVSLNYALFFFMCCAPKQITLVGHGNKLYKEKYQLRSTWLHLLYFILFCHHHFFHYYYVIIVRSHVG